MTLIKKLVIAFGVIIALTVGIATTTLSGLRTVHSAFELNIRSFEVLQSTERLLQNILDIESSERGFIITGDSDLLDGYNRGKRGVAQHLKELRELTGENARQSERLTRLERVYNDWLTDAIDYFVEARRDATSEGEINLVLAEVAEQRGIQYMNDIRALLTEIDREEQALLAQRDADATAAQANVRLVLIAGSVIAVLIAIGAAWLFSSTMASRLAQARSVVQAIAAGQLNTTIDTSGRDEIGDLLRTMARMQSDLRSMISQIQGVSGHLSEASSAVASTAEQLSMSAKEQSQRSASIAASVEELSVSIEQVSSNAGEAQRVAEESRGRTEQSSNVIQNTIESMQRIAEAVRSASHLIEELGEQSSEISSIVNVIKSIADQTNLLALNAAIEAARAGEQGRGFSVVADEVRLLAQRTSESTDQIEGMIAKIQTGTQDAVTQMERGVAEVDQGMEWAGGAGDAINTIRASFEQVLSVVEQISGALKEQNAASDEVARNVESIAQMSDQNREATHHASNTAHRLNQLAGELSGAVARFQV